MGMCRKMTAINDHFQSLEDELEIRDRKIEQIAHDMNIVLTLFSKFEKRVARTEHRTQHQAKSLKHLTDATTTKQDELASRLQNLSNSTKQEMSATSSNQEELARMLQNLSNATTTKQDELASRLQNLSNATTTKQDELASRLQNISDSTKQASLAEAKLWLDNKVSIPIFIICSIRNRVVQGTSRFTQMHSGTSQEDTTLTLFQTSESKRFSSHQISTNLIY